MTKISITAQSLAEMGVDYESGGLTIMELADKYKMSESTARRMIKRNNWSKSERAKQKKQLIDKGLDCTAVNDAQIHALRVRETKETTYKYAKAITDRIMREIFSCDKPDIAGRTNNYETKLGNVKALKVALDGIRTTKDIHYDVLGLNSDNIEFTEMPELVIVEMSAEEVAGIRKEQEDDTDLPPMDGQELARH